MGYRNYSTANGLIVDPSGNGDFKTIGAALTAAVSGDTIFIRPSTYTENPTLKAGVNIVSFEACQLGDPNVTVIGKWSFSSAGSVFIDGIFFQTNSDYILSVTGVAASNVQINNCFFNCTNHSGILSSSSLSTVQLINCSGNLGTTGINFFAISGGGILDLSYTAVGNSGGSSTQSTISAGVLNMGGCNWSIPMTLSGTALATLNDSNWDTSGLNITPFTLNIAGAINTSGLKFISGTATALTITAGTFVNNTTMRIDSTNAAAISNSGTLKNGLIVFTNTGSTISGTPPFQLTINPSSSGGAVVQQVRANTSTASNGATTYALGATPTTSGGTQVLSVAITPTNTAHVLVIEYDYFVGVIESATATRSGVISALFNGGSNAIYAQVDVEVDNTSSVGAMTAVLTNKVTGKFYMTAGTTSATTFTVRLGVYGGGSWYFLENPAGSTINGVQFGSIIVTEYTA